MAMNSSRLLKRMSSRSMPPYAAISRLASALPARSGSRRESTCYGGLESDRAASVAPRAWAPSTTHGRERGLWGTLARAGKLTEIVQLQRLAAAAGALRGGLLLLLHEHDRQERAHRNTGDRREHARFRGHGSQLGTAWAALMAECARRFWFTLFRHQFLRIMTRFVPRIFGSTENFSLKSSVPACHRRWRHTRHRYMNNDG